MSHELVPIFTLLIRYRKLETNLSDCRKNIVFVVQTMEASKFNYIGYLPTNYENKWKSLVVQSKDNNLYSPYFLVSMDFF